MHNGECRTDKLRPQHRRPPLQKTQGWGTLRGNGARQRWATLYNLVGVVKRHVECRRSALPSMWRRSQVLTLTFPLLEGFVFALGVALAVAFCSLRPKLAFRITR